jgi:hypothetical protein
VIEATKTTIRAPHRSQKDPRPDPRVSVEIHDSRLAWPLRLYFASLGDDAELIGAEFGTEEPPPVELDLRDVARVASNLSLYVEYARAEILFDRGDAQRALKVLANVGAPRRGTPGRWFREIAHEYSTRLAAGEKAPVKAIAEAHGVDKSTASRWLKEARRRGYINGGGSGA